MIAMWARIAAPGVEIASGIGRFQEPEVPETAGLLAALAETVEPQLAPVAREAPPVSVVLEPVEDGVAVDVGKCR